jgi:hypothetical protein
MEEGFGGTEIDCLFLWLNFHSVKWSDSQGITCTVLVGQQELEEVAVPSAWWHRYNSPSWNPIASIGKLKSALSRACKPKSISEGKLWRDNREKGCFFKVSVCGFILGVLTLDGSWNTIVFSSPLFVLVRFILCQLPFCEFNSEYQFCMWD